jgi:hypothetical protein
MLTVSCTDRLVRGALKAPCTVYLFTAAADAYDVPVILLACATDRLIRGLYRFPAQGWTSCGGPMRCLSSKAAAVPCHAESWSSNDPATKLPAQP